MLSSFSTFKDMTITREDYENANTDQDKESLILKKTIY